MAVTEGAESAGRPSDRRRLVAVLYADMVGYSRLIGLDEQGTLDRLRALRREVIDPAIEEHGGKIVQTGGDSLLIVFDSIDGAVRCAMNVQQHVPIQDGNQPPDRIIQFRIGINIGDAIADGTDLHGDAVNVAARIQAECPPGGICVTRAVRDHVHVQLKLAFEELGALNLKNLARPVEAFVLKLDDDTTPAPRAAERSLVQSRSKASPLLDKPSIAVLAFTNMSGDSDQEYFSDGVADDIITELSRDRALFVIARNSSFIYKGHAVDVKQVARELSVRYVLEGSVRREATRVRVNAQLIDAETGNHLWAERYDRDLADIFAVQTEIAAAVMTAIAPAIADAELRRALRKPPESLGAWEAYQRGLWHLRRFNEADFEWAKEFFQQAIKLESMFAPAYLGIAQIYTWEGSVLFKRPIDEALKLARENIRRALEIDPDDALAQATLAIHMSSPGNYEAALEQAQQALKRNPNLMQAHQAKGMALLFGGRPA